MILVQIIIHSPIAHEKPLPVNESKVYVPQIWIGGELQQKLLCPLYEDDHLTSY